MAQRFSPPRRATKKKKRFDLRYVETPICSPSYHQMFHGPQYGPKSLYMEVSSLICAASI
jgi:hypothetical protein